MILSLLFCTGYFSSLPSALSLSLSLTLTTILPTPLFTHPPTRPPALLSTPHTVSLTPLLLAGYVCVVTGGRVRIGYQICLKLLRGGGTVITTTRWPEDALLR
jgi:hypothetical protein